MLQVIFLGYKGVVSIKKACEMVLYIDNLGLHHAIKKTRSRNASVNAYIMAILAHCKQFNILINTVWIPTAQMAEEGADGMSRSDYNMFW